MHPLLRFLISVLLMAHSGNCIYAGQVTARVQRTSANATPYLTEFRFTHISHAFDYIVQMDVHIPDGLDGYREGPGQVIIFKKNSIEPLQTISAANLFYAVDDKGLPLTNQAPLYGDQGLINVGDFNFDGLEDFAIQTGHEGPYGGPTYNVFLYNPLKRSFELSEPLSSLIQETLGFFRVDTKHKRLITLAKSGCCYHEATKYAVLRNIPVPVSRIIEDGTKFDGYLYVTLERKIDGKWKGNTRRVIMPKEPSD